eukprot:PITA_01607
MSKAEVNYTVTEKEILAVVHSLNKFRHYITRYQTFVHTDHAAIRIDLPTGEEGMADDQMPNEHLFAISVLSALFADIANYLVSTEFPSHLSSKEEQDHEEKCPIHLDWGQSLQPWTKSGTGKPTPRDETPLQPQATFEPFEKRGMDFVGLINPPSKQKSYIIVCTDYLKKWAETRVIKVATKEKVAEFLRENIFYKFGYPRELVTDQGSQFTSNLIEYLLTHHKIKHITSTPYHP